jgi:hypothetical protein
LRATAWITSRAQAIAAGHAPSDATAFFFIPAKLAKRRAAIAGLAANFVIGWRKRNQRGAIPAKTTQKSTISG